MSGQPSALEAALATKTDMVHVAETLEAIAQAYAGSGAKLQATDLDGTTFPFVDDPEAVVMDPLSRRGYADVIRVAGLRLVAITGGGLDRTTKILEASGLAHTERYAAYGVERMIRGADGELTVVHHPRIAEIKPLLDEARAVVTAELNRLLGRDDAVAVTVEEAARNGTYYAEPKVNMLAFHYAQGAARNSTLESTIRQALENVAGELERLGVHVEHNNGNAEVAFDLDVDKGVVLSELVEGVDTVVFLCDDKGDIPAAQVVRAFASRDGKRGFVAAVYHPPEYLRNTGRTSTLKRGGTPVELIELADVVFRSEGELGAFMSHVVARAAEINPAAVSPSAG